MEYRKQLKKLMVCGLCLLLAGVTAGCGGKGSAPQPPATYSIGANSAPPLDPLLGEGGSLVSIEALTLDGTPVPAEPKDGADPVASPLPEEQLDRMIYTYAELPQGGALVQTYVESLTTEEGGFQRVDAENKTVDPPDYAATTGSVLLVKASDQEGMLFRIRLDWTETSCAVTVDQPGGSLKAEEAESMTVVEAIQYVKTLPPATLGLAGDSMEPYNVYNIDGLVMVDGVLFMQFRVYSRSDRNTNEVAGIYLLSSDKSQIYRLDNSDGTIEMMS